jgi:hypothetical protein
MQCKVFDIPKPFSTIFEGLNGRRKEIMRWSSANLMHFAVCGWVKARRYLSSIG